MESQESLVEHAQYRDYSRYLESGGPTPSQKMMGRNFPSKLHELLSEPRFERIIAWMPHGRAWRILDKHRFMLEAVPQYFGQSKYESFTRQLSNWGFKRLHRPGLDCVGYYHPCFLRGLPKLAGLMVRPATGQGKRKPCPAGEPDFYEISRQHPLPPEAAPAGAAAAAERQEPAASPTLAATPAAASMPSFACWQNQQGSSVASACPVPRSAVVPYETSVQESTASPARPTIFRLNQAALLSRVNGVGPRAPVVTSGTASSGDSAGYHAADRAESTASMARQDQDVDGACAYDIDLDEFLMDHGQDMDEEFVRDMNAYLDRMEEGF